MFQALFACATKMTDEQVSALFQRIPNNSRQDFLAELLAKASSNVRRDPLATRFSARFWLRVVQCGLWRVGDDGNAGRLTRTHFWIRAAYGLIFLSACRRHRYRHIPIRRLRHAASLLWYCWRRGRSRPLNSCPHQRVRELLSGSGEPNEHREFIGATTTIARSRNVLACGSVHVCHERAVQQEKLRRARQKASEQLRQGRKKASNHASTGAIWGIPA